MTLNPFLRRVLEVRELEQEAALVASKPAELTHCIGCGGKVSDGGHLLCSSCTHGRDQLSTAFKTLPPPKPYMGPNPLEPELERSPEVEMVMAAKKREGKGTRACVKCGKALFGHNKTDTHTRCRLSLAPPPPPPPPSRRPKMRDEGVEDEGDIDQTKVRVEVEDQGDGTSLVTMQALDPSVDLRKVIGSTAARVPSFEPASEAYANGKTLERFRTVAEALGLEADQVLAELVGDWFVRLRKAVDDGE